MSAYAPGATAERGPLRCQATTATGDRCQRAALVSNGNWHTCAEPLHIEQGGLFASMSRHVEAASEHLGDAMRHEAWRVVPGPIRHLIEWAFVDLERAQGKP